MSDFAEHCRKIVQRFLLTAVVIDDELYLPPSLSAHDNLIPPSPSNVPSEQEPETQQLRSLNVAQITASFSRKRMVCGVVSPSEGHDDVTLAKTISRADIIILDWQLNREKSKNALPLLKQILSEGPRHQLRLIAIYTVEDDPIRILEEIEDCIGSVGTDDHSVSVDRDPHMIDYGACRIVIYLKEGTHTVSDHLNRIVSEEDLPDHLISDFASKVEGLLPSVVMTALAAVRENVYRLFGRFGSDLDPAFLAHRACLSQPQESEQHIVEQIASELHGIMDDAICTEVSPAGIQAIEHWLKERSENDQIIFNKEKRSVRRVLDMLEYGNDDERYRLISPKKFDILSCEFSWGTENCADLDKRFAWAMSFRQVLDKPQRQLSMGTVILRTHSEREELLLCVTPKCDSVRLDETTPFLFLLLSDPVKDTPKLAVHLENNKYRCVSISVKPSNWRIINFEPDTEKGCVLADCDDSNHTFTFQDVENQEYRWVGELKPEFAQSIAHKISESISRVPLNQSEWLRRSEKKVLANSK